MSTDRIRRFGCVSKRAHCHGCDWMLDARNADGVAAQHHDRTGHYVTVEILNVLSFGNYTEEPKP